VTKFYFDRMYGEMVEVMYCDLSDPGAAEEFSGLLAQVREHAVPFPLVAVDGEVRLAGGAEFHQIKPLVDEMLEARRATVGLA